MFSFKAPTVRLHADDNQNGSIKREPAAGKHINRLGSVERKPPKSVPPNFSRSGGRGLEPT